MPIKPENRKRYPKNWKTEIRPAILLRAEDYCECRGECGDDHYHERCKAPNGMLIVRHRTVPADWVPWLLDEDLGTNLRGKPVKIVLTIAHLNHTPEDCRPENLLALCQRCHLRLDRFEHAKNAAETRRRRRNEGQRELFAEGAS